MQGRVPLFVGGLEHAVVDFEREDRAHAPSRAFLFRVGVRVARDVPDEAFADPSAPTAASRRPIRPGRRPVGRRTRATRRIG
jgi:hypothetical protein